MKSQTSERGDKVMDGEPEEGAQNERLVTVMSLTLLSRETRSQAHAQPEPEPLPKEERGAHVDARLLSTCAYLRPLVQSHSVRALVHSLHHERGPSMPNALQSSFAFWVPIIAPYPTRSYPPQTPPPATRTHRLA